jgi:hypothetical protein
MTHDKAHEAAVFRVKQEAVPYIIYKVNNGQWMCDPYDRTKTYGREAEIIQPPGYTFRAKMQKLRTVYTMLETQQRVGLDPDISLHNLLRDIKLVVDDLVSKTAP